MPHKVDVHKVAEIIKDCARTYIVPRHRLLQDEHIKTKSGPNDLVTIADIETEQALDRIITAEYPDSVLIGEESISAGEKSLDVLDDKSRMVWVTDPVDGTFNFVHGKDTFCVMLACVIDGDTHYGWIYDVPADRMLIAEKGAGVTLDGVRQHVAGPKALAGAHGFAGRKYFPKKLRPMLDSFKGEVGSVKSLACAGHEYLRVTCGENDFGLYTRIRAWDHLAGALAVREAGGIVTLWDGTPYKPQDDGGGLIVASSAALQQELRSTFTDKMVEEYKKRS